MAEYSPITVVYKVPRAKKLRIKTFTDLRNVDFVLAPSSKKYFPEGSEVLEVGIGSSFEDRYKKKYKL